MIVCPVSFEHSWKKAKQAVCPACGAPVSATRETMLYRKGEERKAFAISPHYAPATRRANPLMKARGEQDLRAIAKALIATQAIELMIEQFAS